MYRAHYNLHFLLAASFALAARTAATAQEPYRYAIINVGDIGGNGTDASAINNSGIVVGHTIDLITGTLEAYVWIDGDSRYLEHLPNADITLASDINDRGDVVGRGHNESGTHRALLWESGTGSPVDLGTLGGAFAEANGLNSRGAIVGGSEFLSSGANPFLWENGNMMALGDFGDPGGTAEAINEQSQIVGAAKGNTFSRVRAFLWDDGDLINLGSLQTDRQSSAADINESELIVGSAQVLDSTSRAVIWRNRNIINIHNDTIGYESFAYAVNELGQVVGGLVVDDFPLEFGAFLYEGSGPMVNLATLLPPRHNWLRLEAGYDINDHGEIVGRAYRRGSQERHGYLVTPVHPTLTLQGPQPGRAGTLNGLRVTGCTPGERITFYYSTHGGGTLVPGCNHTDGVTLQLDDPIQIGSAVANQNGIATLTRFVPTGARNLGDVLIQAVQQNGCKISQLVVKRFE